MKKINNGVIFDLDGVIVDTARFHFLAWRNLAQGLGFDITEQQNEELKGISREASLKKILNWGNKQLSEEEFQKQMQQKNENYLSYIKEIDENEILPGVTKIIDYLLENNIPMALGSASKNARPILEKLKLLEKFDAIVDGNDVSKAKPDPQVFLIATKKLNVTPKHCLVFEDSLAGIKAANNAEMTSIGIGEKSTLEEADFVFTNFAQIDIQFIQSLLRN